MTAIVNPLLTAGVSVANAVLVKIKPVSKANLVIMMKFLVKLPVQ
jgi:hypothetical protein